MSKRFLSLLMAVIMVVSMLPVTALAADGGDAAYVAKVGETKYETLNEAFNAATEDDTITLLDDATPALTRQSAITKASVIDLDNHTLTLTEDDLYFGTTEFKNGKIVVNPSVHASTAVFWMFGGQTLTFNGVNIVATGVTGTYLIGINAGTDSAVKLINSSITIENTTAASLTAVIADNGTGNSITIEDSDINVANIDGRFYLGGTEGSVTVTDSEINLNGVKEGFYLKAGQTLSIKGDSTVDVTLNDTNGRYGINLTDATATYTKADTATVNASDNAPAYVATVDGVGYTDIQEAIKAAAPNGTVEILGDVTVDKWVMFAENLSIANGNIITLNINGLTINGNNHTLTIDSIESADNGNRLFYDAQNLNINNLTIKYADGLGGGIGLKSGTIENVTFDGGTYGVLPGTGDVTIEDCTFKTKGTSIYFEGDRDNLVVTRNKFENADGAYAIYLRGNVTFTDNTITTGKVNVVNGSPVVTGNDFGEERFKVYNGATATITGNTIDNLEFNNKTAAAKSIFSDNTLSEAAKAALAAVTPTPAVAQIGDQDYETLQEAIDAAQDGDTITLLADCGEDVTIKQAEGVKITIDGDDKAYTGTITVDGGSKRYETAALTIKNVNFDATDITKDASINLGASGNNNTRYTDNVTMTNCSFTGTGNAKVGIKQYTAGCKNLTVTGCTATGMHSLIQLKNIDGVTVSDCEITGSKSGISLGASSNVMVSNCKMDVTDYGIRADGSGAYDMTVKDCTISADLPIVVRNATGAYKLTLEGTNALDASNTEGYQIIFTNGDDGTYVAPTGDFVLTGADGMKVFPSYVAQIGETKYMTLAAAIDAAQNGETVTVLTDITLAEGVTVPAGKTVTLDLNGKTISGVCNASQTSMITVANTAELTIKDSSDPSTGKITYDGNNSTGWIVDLEGDLVLESGTLELTGTWNIGYAVDVRPNAWGTAYTVPTTFVMNGGKIVSSDSAVRVASNSSDSYEELGVSFTMNGGEIESEWDAIFVQHLYVGDLDVKVVDGTVSGENSVLRVYGEAGSDVKMDIQGGTFSGEVKVADAYADADPIVITGGTYDNDPTTWVADGYVAVDNNNGTWTVSDDYVEWIKAELLAGRSVTLEKDIVVDGSYIDSIPAATNGNGRYFNPGIFNVVGDVDVTFDLNGHTITYNGHADAEYTATNNASYYNGTVNSCTIAHGLFMANAGGNLTIVDSSDNGAGTVNVNGLASGVYACSPDSVITVEGGTWTNDGCAVCGGTNMFLYASHGGEVYITGGTFEQALDSDGDSYLIVEHGGEYKNSVIDYSKTKIEITGGTFVGMNPEEAVQAIQSADNKLSWDTTNVVAEGYCAIAVAGKDNTWTIGVAVAVNVETGKMYGDVTDALDEAESGQTVQMLQNYEENIVVVPAGVTLDLNGCYLTASNLLSFGDVIDTAETTTGGLVIDIDTTKAFTVLQSNNKYLPVYDTNYNENGSVGCYRFYEYKVVSRGISDETSDSVKFKFRMEFTKAEAYNVLAQTEKSGVSVILTLDWTGLLAPIPYTVTNGTVKTWASQMYDRVTTNADSLVSMTLTVKGLSKLEGSSITATPSVQTIAGTVAFDSEMSYTPTAG